MAQKDKMEMPVRSYKKFLMVASEEQRQPRFCILLQSQQQGVDTTAQATLPPKDYRHYKTPLVWSSELIHWGI